MVIENIGTKDAYPLNILLQANKQVAACGTGIDVTVTSSAAEVDANMGIPGYWSK